MRTKIWTVVLAILLVVTLSGFEVTSAQVKSDLDTVTCAPTYDELLTAIEIFSTFASQQLDLPLSYPNQVERFQAQVELLKRREEELQYAESIQNRLAWWIHLKATNFK